MRHREEKEARIDDQSAMCRVDLCIHNCYQCATDLSCAGYTRHATGVNLMLPMLKAVGRLTGGRLIDSLRHSVIAPIGREGNPFRPPPPP